MSYCTNATGYFNIPEQSLDPPDYSGLYYCDRCERLLDADDPWPLCWVCAREDNPRIPFWMYDSEED